MIRLASEADIPRLVEMGVRFRRETEYAQHFDENPEQMARLLQQLIAGDGVLVSEREGRLVGMIGYVLFPHFLSAEMTAGEVFWWTEPEHRGIGIRLLREAERRAKQAGAQRFQMIAPNEQVASMYRRLGYGFVEATYQRYL
jgi:GNAT superfamily N-acetyltransferase